MQNEKMSKNSFLNPFIFYIFGPKNTMADDVFVHLQL